MQTYIALLRGINVAGKNKLPMAELKALCNMLGFSKVQTYIQSGNIVFESGCSLEELAPLLQKEIKKRFDYDVPVLVLTPLYLQNVVDNIPTNASIENLYFTFLAQESTQTLTETSNKEDHFVVDKQCIYIHSVAYGQTKFSNAFFEKKLKVQATTRNYKTVTKLLTLATL